MKNNYSMKQTQYKTAEEILDKVTEKNRTMKYPEQYLTAKKSLIIQAMEEYASQFLNSELPSVNTTINKTCSFGGFCSWKTLHTVPYCTQSGICNYQKG